MKALTSWLRVLFVTAILLVLALPLAVQGQSAPQPEILAEMKASSDVYVSVKLTNITDIGVSWKSDGTTEEYREDLDAYFIWYNQIPSLDLWPVTWAGDALSVQFQEDAVASTGSLEAKLLADGSAVESVEASQVHGGTYVVQESIKAGPIPFERVEQNVQVVYHAETGTYDTRTCAYYALEGPAVADAVQEAPRYTEYDGSPSSQRTEIEFQGAGGSLSRLEVGLCWVPGGQTTPASLGIWEFSSVEVSDPTNPDFYLYPVDENCEWNYDVMVEETSAVTRFINKFDCYGEDVVEMEVSSTHTWTVPKRILVPGESEPLTVAVTAVGPADAPDHPRWSAKTELWYDIPSQDMVFNDGFLASAYYYELDDTNGTLPQSASAQWVVPGGAPGDTMTIQVSVEGISQNARGLLDYHYNYVTVDRTPVPGIGATPEPTEEPSEPWGGGDEEPIDLDDLLAGFGGIGNIPGPETLAQALAGVVAPAVLIAILQALGGGEWDSAGGSGGSDGGPLPAGPTEITLTDTLGRTFDYVWNAEAGGYINPQTGGMLDQSLWAEYNRTLVDNQRFIEEQRERVAVLTPPTQRQQYRSAQEMAERLIARLPFKQGDPLQKRLYTIQSRTAGQGIGSDDVAGMRDIAREAWAHYSERQGAVHRESMDWERKLGWAETGLKVVSTIGRVAGTIAETSLGGSGFVTGFLYGAAENWDKGAGSMLANGLISGTFNTIGTRLGNVNQTGYLWNAGTGGLSLAAETAVTDYYNTGKVNLNNMKWSAGMGAAGGLFGAGVARWMGGGPDVPTHLTDSPDGPIHLGPAPDVPGHVTPDVPGHAAPERNLAPLHEQPPAVQRMAADVEIGPDGRRYAKLEDVLALQESTTSMRSLKNAPDEVREAFNNTLRRDVYDPHDQQLLDWVRQNVPEAQWRELRIDDFRTPGAEFDPSAINTDRDYRILMQDELGDWIEVPKERWRAKSYELFGEATGFNADAVQRAHPEVNWERMTPEQRLTTARELHADRYQQMATDKYSIEASPDYSDQGRIGLSQAQVEQNILAVKHGEGRLLDPDAIGQMDYEKVCASLRRGNQPEAVAQAKKAVSSLRDVREGYKLGRMEVGELPGNLNQAMDAIQHAPVDHRATPEAMAAMNEELARLGYPGGVEQVARTISAQFSALKWAWRM